MDVFSKSQRTKTCQREGQERGIERYNGKEGLRYVGVWSIEVGVEESETSDDKEE